MYVSVAIKQGDKISGFVNTKNGVKQGDVMNPLVFNLFINDLLGPLWLPSGKPYHYKQRAILFESANENCTLFSSTNKVDKFKYLLSCEGKLMKEVARFCKNAFNSRHDLLKIDSAWV